jgi:RNA recognition motif-containing protein
MYVLRPYEAELDEFHPKATRTLFIGNLEKDVTASELRKHFEQFGEIIVSRDCFLLSSV